MGEAPYHVIARSVAHVPAKAGDEAISRPQSHGYSRSRPPGHATTHLHTNNPTGPGMSLTAHSHSAEDDRKPAGSLRLIGSALLWMAVALLGAAAGAVIAGFVVGFAAALMRMHLFPVWYRLNASLFTLVGAFSLQGVFLIGALRQANRIGHGRRRSGLGWGPIDHRGAVVALATILLCCDCALIVLVGHFPLLHRLAARAGSFAFGPVHLGSAWQLPVLACRVVLIVVIAPVCEELFFRGWLWTGLRRVWSISPVMLVTAALWLAMHLADGMYRPLFLIPAAIILTAVRATAGSVRASIAAHMMSNGFVIALVMSMAMFR